MRRAFSGPTKPCRSASGNSTACGPTDAHEPVTDEEHRCGLGVQLQPVVDAARHLVHEFGLRPYRVFLVWQTRGYDRVWTTYRELELTPVKAVGLSEVALRVTPTGVLPDGQVKLRQISPQQVTEDTLRGWIDGEAWASGNPDRQWFYEIRLHERCSADGESRRRRYMIDGEPELRGDRFEWVVRLVNSMPARDRDGADAIVSGEVIPGVQRARLVP